MIKRIFMLCSVIPLGLQVPYLVSAWRSSRLDQWDWIFYLLTLPALLFAWKKELMEKWDFQALFLLLPVLFLAVTPFYHKVNSLAVASAAVCIFAAVWFAASWAAASRILPAIVILLLGTPSSSYAVSLLLMCPVWAAWLVKFLLAALCFVWLICNERFNLQLKKETLCFIAGGLASIFLLLHSKELYFEGRSFVPEFTGQAGEFWGRNIEPDENTRRFFVSSTVKQFRYTKNETDISVLFVKCGKDIHEIHPASHCLRTSFWTIHSEKIVYLQENFAVTEIDAEKGGRRFLIWVWYTSRRFSTPGFLGFRRHFRKGGEYYTCQVSVPVYQNIDQSRNELQQFIKELKQQLRTVEKKVMQ